MMEEEGGEKGKKEEKSPAYMLGLTIDPTAYKSSNNSTQLLQITPSVLDDASCEPPMSDISILIVDTQKRAKSFERTTQCQQLYILEQLKKNKATSQTIFNPKVREVMHYQIYIYMYNFEKVLSI